MNNNLICFSLNKNISVTWLIHLVRCRLTRHKTKVYELQLPLAWHNAKFPCALEVRGSPTWGYMETCQYRYIYTQYREIHSLRQITKPRTGAPWTESPTWKHSFSIYFHIQYFFAYIPYSNVWAHRVLRKSVHRLKNLKFLRKLWKVLSVA